MAKDARSALSEDARGSIEKLIAGAVDALDAGYEIVEVRYTKEYGKSSTSRPRGWTVPSSPTTISAALSAPRSRRSRPPRPCAAR